jgi:hypothetical protein
MSRFLFAAAGLFAALSAASASAQTVDNQYRDWTVFTHDGMCYIGTAPKSGEKDGKIYLLITQRKQNVDEVSTSFGSAFKTESNVELNVDKNSFKLFTQDEVAWARDEATDKRIVDAMKKGSSATVKGTLANGKTSTQKFSLSGFSAAHKRMRDLCK